MQYSEVISQIKNRCAEINLTPRAVYIAAKADPAQFFKWENEINSPTARVFNREVRKVEEKLDDLERELFARLAARLLPEDDAKDICALVRQAKKQGIDVHAGNGVAA